MVFLQTITMPKSCFPICSINVEPNLLLFSSISPQTPLYNPTLSTYHHWKNALPSSMLCRHSVKPFPCFAASRSPDSGPDPQTSSKPKAKHKTRTRSKAVDAQNDGGKNETNLPKTPRKTRRGRKSEAAAVEDYIRNSLQKTLTSIGQNNPELLGNVGNIMKDTVNNKLVSEIDDNGAADDDDDDDGNNNESEDTQEDGKGKVKKKKMVIEEEDPNWPLDADVGWGIRASEYFEKYPIKNVLGEDGSEIDWEGETDDSWVKEINCLEWESFAFHPSPLIVLVFERYNKSTVNWNTMKELEKAAKVYWSAKDRLPPRTVKIDIHIERDLARALKVKECPEILFLRGNRIVYREREFRTADELVQMIAHFYYNARKPSCVK